MNELDKRVIAADRATKRVNHVPVPLYSKSANDPEGHYAGRLAKEITRLRSLPPEPYYSELHQSIVRSRPFTHSTDDRHTDSITGRNLNQYLRKAVAEGGLSNTPEDAFWDFMRARKPLPEPYLTLVALQTPSGLWVNLEQVLSCLSMPTVYRMKDREAWETATALALAFMRQCDSELFEELGQYHDKAFNTGRVSRCV
jgi:hypothetical protein